MVGADRGRRVEPAAAGQRQDFVDRAVVAGKPPGSPASPSGERCGPRVTLLGSLPGASATFRSEQGSWLNCTP